MPTLADYEANKAPSTPAATAGPMTLGDYEATKATPAETQPVTLADHARDPKPPTVDSTVNQSIFGIAPGVDTPKPANPTFGALPNQRPKREELTLSPQSFIKSDTPFLAGASNQKQLDSGIAGDGEILPTNEYVL